MTGLCTPKAPSAAFRLVVAIDRGTFQESVANEEECNSACIVVSVEASKTFKLKAFAFRP